MAVISGNFLENLVQNIYECHIKNIAISATSIYVIILLLSLYLTVYKPEEFKAISASAFYHLLLQYKYPET